MKILEISVEIDEEAAEAVSAVFNQYGDGGVVIEELHPADAPLMTDLRTASPPLLAKTFLSVEHSATLPKIEEALWHLGVIYPILAPRTRWLSDADWQDAWKAGYKAQRVGRRLLIKPSWQSPSRSGARAVIQIDPGMAFGTGLHPSTRLCLLALESMLQPGQGVLDVGTGSGILAMAAARLGASRVVAIEIDDLAMEVARANIARNGVQSLVTLLKASLTAGETPEWPVQNQPAALFNANGQWDGAFDLILMNILPEVIARSARAMAACLRPDGRFVVAGIIQPREGFVRQALAEAGLTVIRRRVRGDWVALTGGKEEG